MEAFLERMQAQLGDEYEAFLRFYEAPHFRGLRVNTLKCTPEKLRTLLPFPLRQTPFCPNGFYLPEETRSPGNHPLHHCGSFYMQEPSATSAAEMLGVEPHDFVLDLCAAPGGKSTQIGAMLNGTGLLWSNEIVKSRANILLSNIERMGISNAVVTNLRPDMLCERLTGFFDKVLVDAPCSGEGMFRKNAAAQTEWSAEHVRSCAERQLKILRSARLALKPGGVLVYSTCTFSEEENEGVITRFLSENPDFVLEDAGVSFGRPALQYARRIYPMDGGEGHFAARLRKTGAPLPRQTTEYRQQTDSEVLDFYDSLFVNRPFGENLTVSNNKIYILPKNYDNRFSGLPVLRAGVILGEFVKRRIEPHHSVFAAAQKRDCRLAADFASDSDAIAAYLHGEEIGVSADWKGYAAVCVNGMTVGFGKASGGRLKNKYPKGLRVLR